MSQENVEIVRRGWEAYERGDLSAGLANISPDVVTHVAPPVSGVYQGREGLLQALLDWAEGFDELVITPEEYIDAGEQVVVRTRQRARGNESGVPVEADVWYVNTVRAGKLVRLGIFVNREEALEAAGLSE
jgi:ketosteroid isomerase-like protein